MNRYLVRLLGLGVALVLASSSQAASSTISRATVEWVLAVEGTPGRCLAKLDRDIRLAGDEFVDCADDIVAFNCVGASNGEDATSRVFDLALLAFETGREVAVRVTDARKQGRYCYATHIQVTRYRSRYYYDDEDDDDDRSERRDSDAFRFDDDND